MNKVRIRIVCTREREREGGRERERERKRDSNVRLMQMVPLQMYPSGQQYPVESLQQWYPYRQLPEPQASPVSHPLTKRKVYNYKQEAQETHQSPEQ